MGLLSDKERNEFKISIRSASVPQLTALFNELAKDRNNSELPDNVRGKAAEKSSMVAWEIKVRSAGGAQG